MTTIHAPTEEDDVTLEQWAGVLGGLASGGAGTALIAKLLGRRRDRADILDTLEQMSVRLTERAMEHADERIAAAEARVREVEQRLVEHQAVDADREQRRRRAAERHIAWDVDVARRLADLGQPVADPPALLE